MRLSPWELSKELLAKYEILHDGLSDMIEDGRLCEDDIPDDYEWLVHALEQLVIVGHAYKRAVEREGEL